MKPVASLADVRAIEAGNWPGELPAGTYDVISRSAALYPEAPALTFFMDAAKFKEAETWSYDGLFRRITQTANAFHALGVGKNDVVSYLLPNLPETHFTIWGGQAAGVVAAFNPLLEPAAIARLLKAVGTKVLVTLAPFPGMDLWRRLQPELAAVDCLEHIVLVNPVDRMAGPAQMKALELQAAEIAQMHGAAGLRGAVPPHIGLHDFSTIVAAQPDDRLASGRLIAADDLSSFFCTGGTTGLPKIAMRRHGNEVANAASVAAFLGDGLSVGTSFFCGLPLFHVNGVLVTGLLPFSIGGHVVIGTPMGYRGADVVKRFWEIVEHYKINFFSAVPTLYATLTQIPVGERDIGSLKYGICGAAPMPAELFRAFQERTGVKILEGYGLTEAVCVSSLNPLSGESRIGSIGIRMLGQAMKAVTVDDRGGYLRDCATDEVGTLVISGPNVFAGYHQDEHNEGLWLDCGDGRRWLNTGDLGRQDPDGYFWLTGRKKELIIRGGHNIDPIAIEEPLHLHPDVQLVAAIGRPDAYAGELPVAYVQLKPGSEMTEAALGEFARERIGERAALPKYIRIVDEIPLTSVGKIFKPALKRREIRNAVMDALAEKAIAVIDVQVVETPSRGDTVEVVLAEGSDAASAQVALGGFSFPCSIKIQPFA